MGIETLLGAGASLIGGVMSSSAASNAADAQVAAADKANATQLDIFNQQKEMSAPYRAAGETAQNRLLSLLGLSGDASGAGYGKYAKDFSMADYTADPGYAFRLSEGLKGLDAQAAARGGLISGAALKAATNYGQNAASAEYQNAYNRYQTNRTNQLAPLQTLTASGQAAAANTAANASNYGNAVNANTMAAGNAQAGGYINQSNAINNALTQGMSSYASNRGSPYSNYGGGDNWLTSSLLNNPLGY